MSDKIKEFPKDVKTKNELFGPQGHPSWHSALAEGHCIPKFKIREWDNQIEIMLDERWIYQFPDLSIARLALTMAANAMAIGEGYPWLGAPTKDRPFAPKVIGLSELPK